MPASNNVQSTHISEQLGILHGALLDIASVMNRPQRDEVLIKQAGIALDRALFPLLVGIERFGPIGVVDLADRVGRDYTTVSRQVATLERQGLVSRKPGATDRRVTEATLSPAGRSLTARIDATRVELGRQVFADWDPGEIDVFVRLTAKFAVALTGATAETGKEA